MAPTSLPSPSTPLSEYWIHLAKCTGEFHTHPTQMALINTWLTLVTKFCPFYSNMHQGHHLSVSPMSPSPLTWLTAPEFSLVSLPFLKCVFHINLSWILPWFPLLLGKVILPAAFTTLVGCLMSYLGSTFLLSVPDTHLPEVTWPSPVGVCPMPLPGGDNNLHTKFKDKTT
jgi:hypothetical protein